MDGLGALKGKSATISILFKVTLNLKLTFYRYFKNKKIVETFLLLILIKINYCKSHGCQREIKKKMKKKAIFCLVIRKSR
jgi:hypothetical protein